MFDVRRARFKKKRPNQGSCFFTGIPDLMVFHEKFGTLFLEVKSIKGKQSDAQKDFESAVRRVGYNYYLVRSVSEVFYILAESVLPDQKTTNK